MAEAKPITDLSEADSLAPPPGLKVISRALEIPLVGDAVDQTLSVHNSMLERGGLFGKAYSLWFSTTCQGLNVAASALKATETTSGATEKVWAKWVSIDDTLAQKLGLELPEDLKKREILIEVGKRHESNLPDVCCSCGKEKKSEEEEEEDQKATGADSDQGHVCPPQPNESQIGSGPSLTVKY